MAKRLQKGWIYRFEYDGPYSTDPTPMVLVLWCGKEWCHSITLNPLSPNLTDILIEMIAQIATKKLASKDAYALYHNYIKKQLPSIVKLAYRTYKTKRIKNEKPVSKGYFHIKHFLKNVSNNLSATDKRYVMTAIKQAVTVAKDSKAQIRRQHIFSLFTKGEKITSEELHSRTTEYVKMIEDIKRETRERMKNRRNKERTYI